MALLLLMGSSILVAANVYIGLESAKPGTFWSFFLGDEPKQPH